MKYKVSIIVPVYNCENYLERCIESILHQTCQDFELILVDDGSKDHSAQIIKEYEKNDHIIGVYQQNQGPSVARNEGMKRATGEFIMFIDSDDYIDENYLEQYLDAILCDNYDVIMGGFTKVTGDKVDFVRKLNGAPFSKYIVGGPCAKIYRRKLLQDHHIEFPVIAESEDVYFNMMVIKAGAKIGYISNTGYYYYFNPQSISNTLHKGFSDRVNILSLMESINFKEIEDKELHEYYLIRYIIWYLLYSGKNTSPEIFLREYAKYFDWIKKNISGYLNNRNLRVFGPAGEQRQVGFIIFIFMLLHRWKMVGLFSKIYCNG